LDNSSTYQVETAVDEACSNIIEHAYQGEDKGDILCTCQADGERLTVILQDHGRSFDPLAVKTPDTKAGLKRRQSHGLGLYFIRRWMDEANFEFSPQGVNTLTMVKYKKKTE